MTTTPIGIDLGTTYSAVAALAPDGDIRLLPNAEGESLTPSVLFFESPQRVIAGKVAKDARADHPERVVEFVKRSMGTDHTFAFDHELYSPIELSSLILKKLKQDAEAALGQRIHQVVITCPAYFGTGRRDATAKAAHLAGLEVMALINEPTAAAFAFGMGRDKHGTVLVFDLGGGTFDATLIRFDAGGGIEVLASDGDAELGGKDFDNALIELVLARVHRETGVDLGDDPLALAELRAQAEQAKHDLTERDTATIRLYPGGRRWRTEISRAEFEHAIRSHLAGMQLTVQGMLDECGLERNDVSDVLLVGGSTRVPAVRAFLGNLFGKPPNTSIHPDEAVARGAALFAAKMLVTKQPQTLLPVVRGKAEALPSVQDVAPHSIGVTVVDDDERHANSIILRRGQALPADCLEHYETRDPGQAAAQVDINEGESDELDYVRQIGSFTLRLPEPRPKGSPIDVRVAFDLSGLIQVTAIDVVSGRQRSIEIDYTENMSTAEVDARRHWLQQVTVH